MAGNQRPAFSSLKALMAGNQSPSKSRSWKFVSCACVYFVLDTSEHQKDYCKYKEEGMLKSV